MATKRRRRSGTTRAVTRRRRTHATHSVGRRRTRRRASVGATTHHRRRRKRSGIGSTTSNVTQIISMAAGVAAGALLTHSVIRPLEHKLVEKQPGAAKFIAGAEVLLGGFMILKGKKPLIRAMGVGVMAGGVHGVMKQFNIAKSIPHLGDSDYTTLTIPMNGTDLQSMVAGILDDGRRNVKSATVAGDYSTLNSTYRVAGDLEDAYTAKGIDL